MFTLEMCHQSVSKLHQFMEQMQLHIIFLAIITASTHADYKSLLTRFTI